MSDGEAHRFYLDFHGTFGQRPPELHEPQELWEYACQHAFQGLDVSDREFVRAIAFHRRCSSFVAGEKWDHGALAPRFARLTGRADVLHIAYTLLYCKADQGRITSCPWKMQPSVREGWGKREIQNFVLGCRWRDRIEVMAAPGLSRWLGREIKSVHCYDVRRSPHGRDQFVWRSSVSFTPGRGFLTVIVRRGLHRPPPISEIYPVSAGTPVHVGEGVWLAEGAWLTKAHKDRPAARGWLAWSYVPGSGTDVEVLVRAKTTAGAVNSFWAAYDALHDTFPGRRSTPADRHLAHASAAPDPEPDPEPMFEPEDLDVLMELC